MSGNGADMGHVVAMLQGLVAGQEEIRRELKDHGQQLNALRANMGTLRNDIYDQLALLRQTVTEYHSTVLGHGMLISELDARLRRVEQHLKLPPTAA